MKGGEEEDEDEDEDEEDKEDKEDEEEEMKKVLEEIMVEMFPIMIKTEGQPCHNPQETWNYTGAKND